MIIIHNQPVTIHELTAAVESTFELPGDKKRKNQQPHRVKVNGKYIVTDSKKTVWSSIGAAKNAIRNHISTSNELKKWIRNYEIQNANHSVKGVPIYYDYSKVHEEIIKYLESNNVIEYVPYTDGE